MVVVVVVVVVVVMMVGVVDKRRVTVNIKTTTHTIPQLIIKIDKFFLQPPSPTPFQVRVVNVYIVLVLHLSFFFFGVRDGGGCGIGGI